MSNKYDKYPLPSTIAFFENAISNHSRVTSIEKISNYYYSVQRKGLPTLKVAVSNIYILSEADVHELLVEYKDVECIVVGASWNNYTADAKQLGKNCNVGVFKFREFFGALNQEGNKFIDYVTPIPNKKGKKGRENP